jgi:hypothetical protein
MAFKNPSLSQEVQVLYSGFIFGKHRVRISHGLQDVLTEVSCDVPAFLEVYARTVP